MILPELPDHIAKVVADHDAWVLTALTTCIQQHMGQNPPSPWEHIVQQTLPLSGIACWKAHDPQQQQQEEEQGVNADVLASSRVRGDRSVPCCLATTSNNDGNSSSSASNSSSSSVSNTTGGPPEAAAAVKPNSMSRSLLGQLAQHSTASVICSPFMGLSGLGDTFTSLTDLASCMPPWLPLPEGVASTLQLQDWNGQPLVLNAYVLDYYKHKQRAALVKDNGLREGDAWEKLRSMSGILAALDSALSDVVVADAGTMPGRAARSGSGGLNDTVEAPAGRDRHSAGGGRVGESGLADEGDSSSEHVAEVLHQVHLSFKERFAVFNGSRDNKQRRK